MKKFLAAGVLVLTVAAVVFGFTWSTGVPVEEPENPVAGWTWSV